jgi:nucleoid-associated protein YgaU
MFFKGSRYAKVAEAELTDASGRVIRYKRTRFIAETPAQAGHRVVQGQRLDHIAWDYYRDPERFWRICDANRAMWPADLVAAGVVLLIPPSEG